MSTDRSDVRPTRTRREFIEAAFCGLVASVLGVAVGLALARALIEQASAQVRLLAEAVTVGELTIPPDPTGLGRLIGSSARCQVGILVVFRRTH